MVSRSKLKTWKSPFPFCKICLYVAMKNKIQFELSIMRGFGSLNIFIFQWNFASRQKELLRFYFCIFFFFSSIKRARRRIFIESWWLPLWFFWSPTEFLGIRAADMNTMVRFSRDNLFRNMRKDKYRHRQYAREYPN